MATVYKLHTKEKSSKDKTDNETTTNGGAVFQNKQRVLMLSSRGVTHRYFPSTWSNYSQRHLMNDLAALLPHSKKDAKLDTKSKLYHLNELADLYNCNNVLFFESRKHGQDLYMWMSKAPNGPSMKLHLQNRILVCGLADLSTYHVCPGGTRLIVGTS